MFDEEKARQDQLEAEDAALEAALGSIERRLNPDGVDLEDLRSLRRQVERPARASFAQLLQLFDQLRRRRGAHDGSPEGDDWVALFGPSGALEPVLARKLGYVVDDLRREAHGSKGYAELRLPFGAFAFTKDAALEEAKDRFERWLGKPAYRFPGKIPSGWPRHTLSVWEWRYELAVLRLKPDDSIGFGVALREDQLSPTVLKNLERLSR
ncbi:MAG: hypothetical protein SFU83_11900 [Meiothermus sp.]|nr:hypothetical protein [Meiothermus sp.]